MRIHLPLLALFLVFGVQSNAQVSPVTNLTWWHQYVTPYNYFELRWEEPPLPHGEVIGYNIYRENEFYRFQTGTNLYYLAQGTNCDSNFQMYNDPSQGFYAHVTAVYAGEIESDYIETVFVTPVALKNTVFEQQKVQLYPNPTSGIVTIGNSSLEKIMVFDTAGKQIKEFSPQLQIDLSDMAKGVYIIKLVSKDGILVDKIIIE